MRERITLYVDTPEGPVSGSSVVESEVVFQDGWLGGLANHSLVTGTFGQATVVDLGTRGALFGLLIPDEGRRSQSYGPDSYPDAAFPELDEQAKRAWPKSTEKQIALFVDMLNRLKPKGEIRLDNLGLLVRFRDPNDPSTVERVDPDDLAASFGRGVRLTRATSRSSTSR